MLAFLNKNDRSQNVSWHVNLQIKIGLIFNLWWPITFQMLNSNNYQHLSGIAHMAEMAYSTLKISPIMICSHFKETHINMPVDV